MLGTGTPRSMAMRQGHLNLNAHSNRNFFVAFFVIIFHLIQSGSCRTIPITGRKPFVNLIDLTDRCLSYSVVWEMQKLLMQDHIDAQDIVVSDGRTPLCVGTVILCQHSSVYTLGTATTAGSGPFSRTFPDGSVLEYETFNVERAGQATYHGPGQLVCYPIMDLSFFKKDINWYLRALEQSVIDTLQLFDIPARRIEGDGLTGVWTSSSDGSGKDSKIAALGIKLRRWVTMHGLSLNVKPDLRYFSNIVPCGISDESKTVATIEQFIPGITMTQVAPVFLDCFCAHFNVELSRIEASEFEKLIISAQSCGVKS